MNTLGKISANWYEIDEGAENQRIDNYLRKLLKGVPNSHLYRILRSGEVRVNSGRVDATYKLKAGDKVRVPPIRTAPAAAPKTPSRERLAAHVLFEDEHLLVLDKPAGWAVHGGSGVSLGVVEQLRLERPQARFLELVHRLDRDTSGILLLARKRSALTALHEQIRGGRVGKFYAVLVHGRWPHRRREVKLALDKYVLASGERRVAVNADGQAAHTIFSLVRQFDGYSLLEAELKTGRTHQIRVHLAHLGFPIAGDDKYGDYARNRDMAKQGLKRMFLHAARVRFVHPATAERVSFEAPLPAELQQFVDRLQPAAG
jgi:23S rRNA pseudouridine955/2504/2580 synthase